MDGAVDQARAAGFTLVELMIVVTVLSLLTLTVGLGVNRPRNETAQDWSRFKAVHDRMREQAVLGREVLGLAVSADGYQRLRRAGGHWQEIGAPVRWRSAVTVQQPFDRRAPLVFGPGGQGTKLRLRFDGGAVVICESDGWAAVSCGAV